MKSHLRFTTFATAAALALGTFAAAPAMANEQRFGSWDADQSGTIDRDEFQAGAADAGMDKQWTGEKPYLTRQEFHRAIGDTSEEDLFSFDAEQAFDNWDQDGDGQLTREEYNQGRYSAYDADESGDLDESEFGMFEGDADKGGWFE